MDDFVVRRFATREISLFWLISRIAANTIDNVRMLEKAMMMAITDELTSLYNHRYFKQRLAHELNRASRYGLNLTLTMIDVDGFKQYNDHNGHLLGNDVLRKLSSILKEGCRDSDVAARYGGEEFAIIMPETSARDAIKMVERLRKRVAENSFNGRSIESRHTVTISAGIATYPVNANTAIKLIERADNALYDAKRLGKNRVVLSHRQEKPRKKSRTQAKKLSTTAPA